MTEFYKEPNEISVSLNSDEAIVLFELLSRWINDNRAPTADKSFEHSSELATLQNVLTSLESQLAAPFRQDYKLILHQSRERVSSSRPDGEWSLTQKTIK